MEIPAWSLPTGSGNFSWRKLGPDNVAEVGSLIHRIEEFDNPPFRTAISEVEDFLRRPPAGALSVPSIRKITWLPMRRCVPGCC